MRKNSPLDNLKDTEVEVRYGDVMDEKSLEEAMRDCKAVIHTAAVYKFWDPNPQVFYDTNLKGTLNVIETAKKLKVERVVYTSTTACIGATKTNEPLDESALENPPPHHFDLWRIKDWYVRSKILAQKEVLKKAQEGMDIVVVSPSAPVGWGDIKPTPTGLLILKFLNREVPFYSDVGLCPVNVKDIAKGHILALEKGKKGEVYILGGENLYLSEIFSILSELTGLSKPLKFPRKISAYLGIVIGFLLEVWAKLTGSPPLITRAQARASLVNLFYSSEKAKRELGYSPTPVREAFKDAIKYFLERGMVKKKIAKKLESRFKS